MSPSLRQLRAFIAVARYGQFTRAANELDISQSSLSESIRELEAALEVRLFDRHTRMLQLTKAGSEFLTVVQRLVGELDGAVDTMRAHATLERGMVVIAAPGLQSALQLPAEITAFSALYPSIDIVLHDVPEYEVTGLVQSGVADLGLVTTTRLPSDLRARPFDRDHFVVILAPSHPLAQQGSLTWDDLTDMPLIGLKATSPMRRALDEALAIHDIRLTFTYEVSLPLTIAGLVQAGLGIALVTSLMAPISEWLGLAVRSLDRPRIERDLMLIQSRDRSLNPAAQKMHDQLLRKKRQQ
ncbi:LysR family transcriptional regulator [Shinella sp. BYT-45]|uniref:LysR family transcriptional regulator n=1 Tax=Shinella sp. BYT-45 TaxID=3377377 RepID=UPI00397FA8A0